MEVTREGNMLGHLLRDSFIVQSLLGFRKCPQHVKCRIPPNLTSGLVLITIPESVDAK